MSTRIDLQDFSHLVGLIYDSVLEPERWSAALAELRNVLGFKNAAMTIFTLPSGRFLLHVTSGIEPYWLQRMSEYGADIVEAWGGVEAVNSYPFEEPGILSHKRHRSLWESNHYVKDWAAPQGIFDALAFAVARDGEAHGSIGMGRHTSRGEISEAEFEAVRLLVPHFQRAVAISRALDLKTILASSFSETLDSLAAGVVLVDGDLTILHVNKAGAAMLADGDPIYPEHARLALPSRGASAALGSAVRQSGEQEAGIGRRGFGIPAPRRNGEPAVLHVLPLGRGLLRPGLNARAVAAVVVARAAGPKSLPKEALATLFDLTPTEARLLEHIAAGKTLSQAAHTMNIGPSTARTHLLRLFDKTGTHRQVELVRLAASLSLPF